MAPKSLIRFFKLAPAVGIEHLTKYNKNNYLNVNLDVFVYRVGVKFVYRCTKINVSQVWIGCLWHTLRYRLRTVECPTELLDALGGWSAVQGAGRRYGAGFTIEQKRSWLQRIAVCFEAD